MSGALTTRRSSTPSPWSEPRGLLDDFENRLARLWEDGQQGWFGGSAVSAKLSRMSGDNDEKA